MFCQGDKENGMVPGFVTLNPSIIPEIVWVVGKEVWFMT